MLPNDLSILKILREGEGWGKKGKELRALQAQLTRNASIILLRGLQLKGLYCADIFEVKSEPSIMENLL